MSEATDAVVVIVSEETGTISVAFKGELTRDLTEAKLREMLIDYLIDSPDNRFTTGDGTFSKTIKGMKKWKSVKRIKEISLDELIKEIGRKKAELIIDYFRSKEQ